MAHSPANPTGDSDTPTAAYLNGDWVDPQSMRVSVDDDGFRSAATAVERMRTYDGRIFEWNSHLARWRQTLAAIGIANTPTDATIETRFRELLSRNEAWVRSQGDVGITMFATPGQQGKESPTFAMHFNAIDHEAVLRRRTHGQPLVITEIRQPSAKSWPRAIKVRCRLHYYLADQAAKKIHADACGVLLDDDDSITETSVANIAIVKDGSIISPPSDRILDGITQQVVSRIARSRSIAWTNRPVTPKQLRDADEILLMGTDTGIWFANRVDTCVIAPGPVYSSLLAGFDEYASSATDAS